MSRQCECFDDSDPGLIGGIVYLIGGMFCVYGVGACAWKAWQFGAPGLSIAYGLFGLFPMLFALVGLVAIVDSIEA